MENSLGQYNWLLAIAGGFLFGLILESIVIVIASSALFILTGCYIVMTYMRNNREPPSELKEEVENFLISDTSQPDYYRELGRIRQRVIDYPTLVRRLDEEKRYNKILRKLDEYWTALDLNLNSAVKRNDYGAIVEDFRDEKIIDFLQSVDALADYSEDIDQDIQLVKDRLKELKASSNARGFNPRSSPEDGLAFESWVAQQLNRFGWKTRVTRGSGDQGVDVVALKGKAKVGVQCKRYTQNVSNSAVQQAHAARTHFRLTHAVVVSTSGYTESAKALGRTTNVLLITTYDLPNLDRKIGIAPS